MISTSRTVRNLGAPFNLGQTAIAGTNGTYVGGQTSISGPYAMTKTGMLYSVTIYSRIATGATAFLGVYDNTGSGSIPNLLLAKTLPFVPVSTGWQTILTSTNPIIFNGTNINIGVLAVTTTMGGVFDSAGPAKFYFDNSTSETQFANPFVNNGVSSPFVPTTISIYATFTTV